MDVLQALNYDPETGLFTWAVSTNKKVKVGDIAGSVNKKTGYVEIRLKGVMYYGHRLAFLFMTGSMPKRVDHKDNVRHNNVWSNLREATAKQNSQNSKIYSNNTSGVKGVNWEISRKRWRAECCGKFLGYFIFKEVADAVVTSYRETQHGEFANHG
ncbi:putative HNH endonuclease [Erwinia phage Aioli]|nr:putative HNH endonuclease [Erwinia phage Aioli]